MAFRARSGWGMMFPPQTRSPRLASARQRTAFFQLWNKLDKFDRVDLLLLDFPSRGSDSMVERAPISARARGPNRGGARQDVDPRGGGPMTHSWSVSGVVTG